MESQTEVSELLGKDCFLIMSKVIEISEKYMDHVFYLASTPKKDTNIIMYNKCYYALYSLSGGKYKYCSRPGWWPLKGLLAIFTQYVEEGLIFL